MITTTYTPEEYFLGDLVEFSIRATSPDDLVNNDFKVSIISQFGDAIEKSKSDLVLDGDRYMVKISPLTTKTMKEGTYKVELWIGGTCTAKFNNVFKLEDCYSKKFVQ